MLILGNRLKADILAETSALYYSIVNFLNKSAVTFYFESTWSYAHFKNYSVASLFQALGGWGRAKKEGEREKKNKNEGALGRGRPPLLILSLSLSRFLFSTTESLADLWWEIVNILSYF